MTYFYKAVKSPVCGLRLIASDKGLAAILWEKDNPRRVPLGPFRKTKAIPCFSKPSASSMNISPASENPFRSTSISEEPNFRKRFGRRCSLFHSGKLAVTGKSPNKSKNQSGARGGSSHWKESRFDDRPCHGVIGSTGKLTGFAGGLETKACLLALEANTSQRKL